MQIRRLFLLLCLLLAASAALAACEPASPPDSWDLVLAAPAGATADAAQSAADAYAQATGLRIHVQTFPGDAYLDHIFAVLLAGTGEFDLVYLSAESLPKWADYHTLQPLNLPVNENIAPWLPLLTVEGEVFGVPVDPDVDVLWYRADLLDASGVLIPTRWDEVLAISQTVNLPFVLAGGEMDAGRDLVAVMKYWNWMGQGWGGWFVGRELLVHEVGLFAELGGPSYANWTRADVQKALVNDQAAMGILPLSAAGALLDCEQSEDVCKDGQPLLTFASLPLMEDSLGVASVQAWAVPLKASHPETAQDFAAWLASAEGARAWSNAGGLPAHRVVLAEMDSPAAQALAQIETAQPAFPPLIPAGEIWRALNIAGHGAAEGKPPELLVEEMVQSIETALRQSGYTVIEE